MLAGAEHLSESAAMWCRTAYGKMVKTVDASQCIVIKNMAALALDLLSQEGQELRRANPAEMQSPPPRPPSSSQAYIILESRQHDPNLHVLVASKACCDVLGKASLKAVPETMQRWRFLPTAGRFTLYHAGAAGTFSMFEFLRVGKSLFQVAGLDIALGIKCFGMC